MLHPIELRTLAASPTRKVALVIDEASLPGLATLTPVQGELSVVHRGDFVEVEGEARTIVTLTCDRCLKRFNHRLQTVFNEVIWLEDAGWQPPLEQEVSVGDLDEHLPRDGQLDPLDLIYQHLCLELPLRNLCDEDCQLPTENGGGGNQAPDSRWSALSRLRQQLD